MASLFLIKLTLLAAIIHIAYSVGIYEQCAGEGYGSFPCNAGMGCFRRNRWYSSCQYSCPLNVGWECESYVTAATPYAAGWDQCAGEGWGVTRPCAAGFVCHARSVYYAQCRPANDCPADWACNAFIGATTPGGPVILAAYARCNDVGTAICRAGTACFRSNALYAECRSACPSTWACETDVAGLKEQCGGEGYVGLNRCSEGLRCYARSKWYSECAATCPGVEWAC